MKTLSQVREEARAEARQEEPRQEEARQEKPRKDSSVSADADPLSRLEVASPLGRLRLVARDACLVAVVFEAHRNPWAFMRDAEAPFSWQPSSQSVPGNVPVASASQAPSQSAQGSSVLAQAATELEAFFAGRLRRFSTPLGFEVGTPFYREVWAALLEIPFGQRRSYGELARTLGRPSAARAVGTAVARNPLSLFVPCHRVVGGEGQLTGFAGGLPAKQWLLQHEGATLPREATLAGQINLV